MLQHCSDLLQACSHKNRWHSQQSLRRIKRRKNFAKRCDVYRWRLVFLSTLNVESRRQVVALHTNVGFLFWKLLVLKVHSDVPSCLLAIACHHFHTKLDEWSVAEAYRWCLFNVSDLVTAYFCEKDEGQQKNCFDVLINWLLVLAIINFLRCCRPWQSHCHQKRVSLSFIKGVWKLVLV